MICVAASNMKSTNIKSATARQPLAEAPMAAPVKPSSANRRVDHPLAAEFVPQALGVGKTAAALARSLAHVDDVRIAAHFLGDRVAHGFQISLHDGFGPRIDAGQRRDAAARPKRGRWPRPDRDWESGEKTPSILDRACRRPLRWPSDLAASPGPTPAASARSGAIGQRVFQRSSSSCSR